MQLNVLDIIATCLRSVVNIVWCTLLQREVYPALVLFPAEKKKPLLYEGDMAVVDVMKFVAEHGSNFHHLIREKGKHLWVICYFCMYGLLKASESAIVGVKLGRTLSYDHCLILVSYLFLFPVSTCIRLHSDFRGT